MKNFSNIVGYWLSRAQVSNAQIFARNFASLDLTMLQFGILTAVWEEPGLRQKDLAKRLSTVPPVIVKPLENLENRGLIKRTRMAPDRRAQMVHLTKEGQEIVKKGFETSVLVDDIMMQGIDAKQKKIVLECLDRIIKNVDAAKKSAAS